MKTYIFFDAEFRSDLEAHGRYRGMERLEAVANPFEYRERHTADCRVNPRWCFKRMVAASWLVAVEDEDGQLTPLRMKTVGQPEVDEAGILRELFSDFRLYGKFAQIVTWGGNTDIPLIRLAAMEYGIRLPEHMRGAEHTPMNTGWHFDLMFPVCGGYRGRERLHMAEVAARLSVPAKLVCRPDDVADLIQRGKWSQVKAVAEGDVLTTALLFVRYQNMLGGPDPFRFDNQLCSYVRDYRDYREYREDLLEWCEARRAEMMRDVFARANAECAIGPFG